MRWEGRERSQNVDDRRGMKGPAVGGGILVIIVGAIIALLNGANPLGVVMNAQQQIQQQQQQAPVGLEEGERGPRADDKLAEFCSVVMRDTEKVWEEIFPKLSGGQPYQPATLVLYDARVETRGCGNASSSAGPFYCGGDGGVYIDLSFFNELQTKFKAPGEFACAYVIAHEVGHHVQNLLGMLKQVQRQQDNQMLVRLELQADFLAGVWAHHAQKKFKILEEGDIESGINAAQQVGDDTIMKNAGVRPVPDSFTHGTSQQRMRWFVLGLKTGDPRRMNDLFELPYDEL
jgi:uncharacterized protein